MGDERPLENPGTSLVFYQLTQLSPELRTAARVQEELGLGNWNGVKEQLRRLENARFLTSGKPTGKKARTYDIRWDRVVSYGVDSFLVVRFVPWWKDNGQNKHAEAATNLATELKKNREFEEFVRTYLGYLGRDFVREAKSKRGRDVLTAFPEYAVGAVLRNMQREIVTYLPTVEKSASRKGILVRLHSLLSELVEFYSDGEPSVSGSMLDAMNEVFLGTKSGQRELVSTGSRKVIR